MESPNPSFNFELKYADKLVNCDVVMNHQSFDVLFNERWMASIVHTDDWEWIQESGVILPEAIIDEIGLKVESEYQ